MDYRALLAKYMNHVCEEEGIYFMPREHDKEFSAEERAELAKIRKEIDGTT